MLNNLHVSPSATFPTIKARPAAKKAPTIQENTIGNPNPPRNPVVAGFTASIASILGSDVILNNYNSSNNNCSNTISSNF